jgi:hypothetical protein
MANNIAMNITSKIVALSSAVAFALQIALALLMLRYFSPEEVGMFSVISQIGFFWTTLALAQAPLRLLANQGVSVYEDVISALLSSIQRFVWLLPVTAVAVWWSGLPFVSALLWTFLLSLCQLTWMLAQSMRLRMVGTWGHVLARVLPPFISLLVTFVAVQMQWDGPSLLIAALTGYAIGALSIVPAFFSTFQFLAKKSIRIHSNNTQPFNTFEDGSALSPSLRTSDARPAWLRMAHSLIDALLATALLVIWQRQFGSQETGWLAAPLRIMGFIPAVIHMAWAQVLLAQHKQSRINPTLVGLTGFSFVALIGASCFVALNVGWISYDWQGVKTYLLMLVMWQGFACMTAAYSHRPFQTHESISYSIICTAISIAQFLVLVVPVIFNFQPTPHLFFSWFAIVSFCGLSVLFFRLKNLI